MSRHLVAASLDEIPDPPVSNLTHPAIRPVRPATSRTRTCGRSVRIGMVGGWFPQPLVAAVLGIAVTVTATIGRADKPVVEPQRPEGEQESNMNTEYVTYLKPIGPSATMSILAVEGDETELILTGPSDQIDGFDRVEIGVYLRELESGDYEAVRTLANEAIAAAEETTVPPGTPLLTVGIGDEADESLQAVSFPLSTDLPETVRRLDRKMVAVASFLARFPDQTLLGTARWDRPEVTANELRLTLTLTSSGAKTVRVNHPASAPEDSEVGLTLVLERDLPDEQLEDEDRGFLPIGRDGVRLTESPGWDPGEPAPDVIPLKPGESMTLSVSVTSQVFLEPGSYRGTIRFESQLGDLKEDQGVEGILVIRLGKVTILPSQGE